MSNVYPKHFDDVDYDQSVVIYRILREDLKAVYIGATLERRFDGRIRAHRLGHGGNSAQLFEGGEPVIDRLAVVPLKDGPERESMAMVSHRLNGYRVVSTPGGGSVSGMRSKGRR